MSLRYVKRGAAIFLSLTLIFAAWPVAAFAADSPDALPSLKEIYKDHFLIGNVFSMPDISGDRFELLSSQFNVLTAENAMKPIELAPKANEYSFDASDFMVSKFTEAGVKIHGHTLSWHQQSPDWLNQNDQGNPLTRAEAEASLKAYVNEVAGHFKGKLISWDVLNEGINDNPDTPSDWRKSLRATPWLKAFASNVEEGQSGSDYVDFLFRAAREADPDAILYYNDYNLDVQSKAEAVANMVKEINDAWLAEGNSRLLIDGVGMQGHYNTDTVMEDVEASIKLFAELGVEISITELDISVPGVSKTEGLTEKAELRQAATYAKLFSLFKKYSDVIARVTFWGLDDASSWRAEQFPMLFNADLSPKQAFYAVADPEGFLAGYTGEDEGPRRGTAAYGTPELDGKIDDIWAQSEELHIDRMLQAWDTASGTARVLWDEENLYVLFEVNDPNLDNSSTVVHEKDTVEAFVDEQNCKNRSYQKDDGQYRVCYDNSWSFNESTNMAGFGSASVETGTGYIVEMKIPFKVEKPSAGMVIGFDAQVNDGEGGTRVGMAKWCDPTDNSWKNPSGWGEVELLTPTAEALAAASASSSSAQNETAEAASDTPAQEEAPAVSGETPVTNMSAVVFAIAGVVVVAAVGLIFYRKKKFGKK